MEIQLNISIIYYFNNFRDLVDATLKEKDTVIGGIGRSVTKRSLLIELPNRKSETLIHYIKKHFCQDLSCMQVVERIFES